MLAIDDGAPIKTVARLYGIPTTSLRDHVFGKTLSRKRGKSGVLSSEEENELVNWIFKMQTLGHPITLSQCRLKVAEITQDRYTPFTNGIPGPGWVKWFKARNPTLTLRVAQGLEQSRAKGLCPENVASLYDNLQDMYTRHKYPETHIWNCDESGAQAGRNGEGVFWLKREYGVYILSLPMRENGCQYSHASMLRDLVFLTFIYSRVGYLGGIL